MPADWARSGVIDFTDTSAAKTAVLEEYAGWDDDLRALVADSEGELRPYPLVALPTGHRWEHTPGVTLLGDAAHVMSPFAGEGANLAMLDALRLGTAIADNPEGVDVAIAGYEQELFTRSAEAAAMSASNLELAFGPHGGTALAELMNSFERHGE